MYSLFMARFVGENSQFNGFNANFSTTKKVAAFQSSLRKIGFRPIVLVTHTGDIPTRPLVIKKIGDCICIIPASSSVLHFRILRYLFGVIYSAILVYQLRKRVNFSIYFSWDYLPDTLLPLILQGRFILKKTIVDIEESLSADPLANIIFKYFEQITSRFLPLRTIVNNVSTAQSLKVNFEGVFQGFFANSLEEENRLLQLTERKIFNNKIVIFFSGRLDNIRGAHQFIALACHFEAHEELLFIMTGYGSLNQISQFSRRLPSNILFRPGVPRSEYIDLLFQSDIAFNFISDKNFISNSFPSKVVEYLLGSVIVISNHPVDIKSKRVLVRESLEEIVKFIANYIEHKDKWRASYCPEEVKIELNQFSISRCSSSLKRIING